MVWRLYTNSLYFRNASATAEGGGLGAEHLLPAEGDGGSGAAHLWPAEDDGADGAAHLWPADGAGADGAAHLWPADGAGDDGAAHLWPADGAGDHLLTEGDSADGAAHLWAAEGDGRDWQKELWPPDEDTLDSGHLWPAEGGGTFGQPLSHSSAQDAWFDNCEKDYQYNFDQCFGDDDDWVLDDSDSSNDHMQRNLKPVRLETTLDGDCLNFLACIRKWVVQYRIEHYKAEALFDIIRKFTRFSNIPRSVRTLLKVKRAPPNIIKMQHFEYYTFDIKQELTTALDNYKSLDNLSVLMLSGNFDGISMFKSSRQQAWPFLISPYNIQPSFVIIAMFSYGIMPKDLSFLNDVIDQINALMETGLLYKGRVLPVRFAALCCDLPARAKIRGSKMHNGYNACSHCWAKGEYAEGEKKMLYKNTFPRATCRTHAEFVYHDAGDHLVGESPLRMLQHFDTVQDCILDIMHLVHLGE